MEHVWSGGVDRLWCCVYDTEKCGRCGVERISSEEKVPTRTQGQGGKTRCVESVVNVVMCGH